MDILRQAATHWHRLALAAGSQTFSYADLFSRAAAVKAGLALRETGELDGPRIALLAPPGPHYVAATWGTWLAGGVAVPLCTSTPEKEQRYVLEDAGASVLLAHSEHGERAVSLTSGSAPRLQLLDDPPPPSAPPQPPVSKVEVLSWLEAASAWPQDRGALMVYTSGTTGRPKGALHTHRGLAAQVAALTAAWEWRPSDRILHALPLHHVHGIINALYCAHAAGAAVEALPRFSPAAVWGALLRREAPVTVFMGVPTMYAYLLGSCREADAARQAAMAEAARGLRLAVSGSAPCPLPILQQWQELSGQTLLERYGMTETGMVLSNPLRGERRPGTVGTPLPGVAVRTGGEAQGAGEEGGELLVKGEGLFREHWGRPEATAEAFDADGWFRTGDTAECSTQAPYWRILGRTSVDIIKSSGYKVSALAVENEIAAHPAVREVAVVGVPDDPLGERIEALVALAPGADASEVTLDSLRHFLEDRLPPYQLPRGVRVLDELPRNAMGKVNKKQLVRDLFPP